MIRPKPIFILAILMLSFSMLTLDWFREKDEYWKTVHGLYASRGCNDDRCSFMESPGDDTFVIVDRLVLAAGILVLVFIVTAMLAHVKRTFHMRSVQITSAIGILLATILTRLAPNELFMGANFPLFIVGATLAYLASSWLEVDDTAERMGLVIPKDDPATQALVDKLEQEASNQP